MRYAGFPALAFRACFAFRARLARSLLPPLLLAGIDYRLGLCEAFSQGLDVHWRNGSHCLDALSKGCCIWRLRSGLYFLQSKKSMFISICQQMQTETRVPFFVC